MSHSLSPEQFSFTLQGVQLFDLAVQIPDFILQLLSGNVHLLTQLREGAGQLPVSNKDSTMFKNAFL